MCVCVSESVCESVSVRERESERVIYVCVCVCVRERKRESVCMLRYGFHAFEVATVKSTKSKKRRECEKKLLTFWIY